MSTRVALVTCVKTKRSSASAARDLYISPFFRGLRGYAEVNADAWYILSAEHGLLHPDATINPYEKTLNRMPKQERVAWAERVQQQLLDVLPAEAEIILLVGSRYRENLEPFLRAHGFSVTVPLQGLRFGQQLQRLKDLLAEGSRGR
jgi:hypothetical protein